MNNFEIIEHTADIGVRVKAANEPELFATAATAMFSIITELDRVDEPISSTIELSADNLTELFVRWLSELLFLYDTKEIIFKKFEIKELSPQHLLADVHGEKIDLTKHTIKTEIKLVTYHQLKVERNHTGWIAEVIFDI